MNDIPDKETRGRGDKEAQNHADLAAISIQTHANAAAATPPAIPASFSFLLSPFSFWALAALITLISMALQFGGLGHEAVIDDHGWLRDPVYRGCGQNAWECFRHPQLYYYYRPLVAVSFVLGLRLHPLAALVAPDEARPFHIENLLMHGMAVLLVFWLLRLLIGRGLPALISGLLFALHPLNVPVTTFIGGRTDNLALIFLALWAIGLIKGQRSFLWRVLSLLAFMGALFTKEQCYLLLLLAPTLASWRGKEDSSAQENSNAKPASEFNSEFNSDLKDKTPDDDNVRTDWRRLAWLAWFAVPAFAHLWFWRRVGQTMQAEDQAAHAVTRSFFAHAPWGLGLHIEMIGRTCWYYACCFLFPTVSRMHQSTLGPWDCAALGPGGCGVAGMPQPPSLWLAGGGYVALGFSLWLTWRTWKRPACRVCLLWLGLTLLPCLNFIPVPSQFIAPYRALIPLVGVCGLMGALIEQALTKWRRQGTARRTADKTFDAASPSLLPALLFAPVLALLAVVCVILAWASLLDVAWWKNDGMLMQAEMRYDLNFVPARTGEAFLRDQNGDVEAAIASYDTALRQLLPESGDKSGGERTGGKKRSDNAADVIIRAAHAPDMPRRIASASSLRYNDVPYLANSLLARGGLHQRLAHWSDAAEDYRAAQALMPLNANIGDWLAYALDHAGRWPEAEKVLIAQIARRADSYRLSQLGSLYFRQGRWEAARDMLGLALQAPASDMGASMDAGLARQQYQQASALSPHKPQRKQQ